MSYTDEILDSLDILGYLEDTDEFQSNNYAGFSKIVSWLSRELQVSCQLESCVNAIKGDFILFRIL